MTEFKATHRITYDVDGEERTEEVMLQANGSAPTEQQLVEGRAPTFTRLLRRRVTGTGDGGFAQFTAVPEWLRGGQPFTGKIEAIGRPSSTEETAPIG